MSALWMENATPLITKRLLTASPNEQVYWGHRRSFVCQYCLTLSIISCFQCGNQNIYPYSPIFYTWFIICILLIIINIAEILVTWQWKDVDMEDNPLETQAKIHTELSINPPEAHVKIKRYGTVPLLLFFISQLL